MRWYGQARRVRLWGLRWNREAHRPVRPSPRRLVPPGSPSPPRSGPAPRAEAHTHHPDPPPPANPGSRARRMISARERFRGRRAAAAAQAVQRHVASDDLSPSEPAIASPRREHAHDTGPPASRPRDGFRRTETDRRRMVSRWSGKTARHWQNNGLQNRRHDARRGFLTLTVIVRTNLPMTPCSRKHQNPVRQANWQKVGGVKPLERRSNRPKFLREPCVGSREGAGEASVAVRMGRANEHRKGTCSGCRGFRIGRRQHRWHRYGERSASPAVSENPCTFARLVSGPWEVFKLPRMS